MAWADDMVGSLYFSLSALTGTRSPEYAPPEALSGIAKRASANIRLAILPGDLSALYGLPPHRRAMGVDTASAKNMVDAFNMAFNQLVFPRGAYKGSKAVEDQIKARIVSRLVAGVYPAISLPELRMLYANVLGQLVGPKGAATGTNLLGMGQAPPQVQQPQQSWATKTVTVGNINIPMWLIVGGIGLYLFRRPAKSAVELTETLSHKALVHAKARAEAIPEPVRKRRALVDDTKES